MGEGVNMGKDTCVLAWFVNAALVPVLILALRMLKVSARVSSNGVFYLFYSAARKAKYDTIPNFRVDDKALTRTFHLFYVTFLVIFCDDC